jgi:hypothetical protein
VKTAAAYSPEELAEKVAGHDLVLTVEASLADAVNSYLEEEKVFTPMQLVDADREFRKKVFLEVVDEKDLTWKQTSYLLENVLSCWKHTGELENILDYPEFQTEEVEELIQLLENRETPYSKIQEFEVDAVNVAVLKEYQFTEIDRQILPENYEQIESFSEEEQSLDEFKVFSSALEMVQSLKENIQRLDPEKVGVAVKPGSKYEPLLKSVLEAEDLPFQRRSHAREDEDVRTFLSLLETGLSGGRARVKDVRPIIRRLDVRIPRKHENRKLDDIQEGEEFKEFLNAMEYLDFGDAVERYHDLTERETGIAPVLEELGLMDEQVSEESVNSIRYYLDSFEVNPNEFDEGVLLADPTKVSQIDREYVFHLGMDTEWMREIGEKEWIDRDSQERRHLRDFRSLIQSGNSYFLVQDQELNEAVTPCFYLNEIIEQEFTSFSELPHTRVGPEEKPEKQGFKKENYGVKPGEVELISQSALNSFVLSPRLYYMDELVSDADQQRLEKGNLFHMYAEYHANNPDKASEIPLSDVVELMMDEIDEFADELDLEDLETQFRIGVKHIRSFLEKHELEEVSFSKDEYFSTDEENVFVREMPGDNTSLRTEPYFKDFDLGAKGKIDLVLSENHLVDYKSGRRKTVQKVLKKSHVELYEDEKFPDFQPLLYITHHRKHVDGPIKFTFFHFLNEMGNAVNGGEATTETTITYHPERFQEKKASMEVFEKLIRNVAKSNDRRKTLEKLGYSRYKEFMNENQVPEPFDKNKLLETDFAERFEEFAKQNVGDYKYVENGARSTLKKLVEYRLQNYFKEDADKMEQFLNEKLDQINNYIDSRFPVDAKPEELPNRDLILK